MSPTVRKTETGEYDLAGPKELVVHEDSAVNWGTQDSDHGLRCAIARTHSDVIKFTDEGDEYYKQVRNQVSKMCQEAIDWPVKLKMPKLFDAVESQDCASVNSLLRTGVFTGKGLVSETSRTLLEYAARDGLLDIVHTILRYCPAEINRASDWGETALFWAARIRLEGTSRQRSIRQLEEWLEKDAIAFCCRVRRSRDSTNSYSM